MTPLPLTAAPSCLCSPLEIFWTPALFPKSPSHVPAGPSPMTPDPPPHQARLGHHRQPHCRSRPRAQRARLPSTRRPPGPPAPTRPPGRASLPAPARPFPPAGTAASPSGAALLRFSVCSLSLTSANTSAIDRHLRLALEGAQQEPCALSPEPAPPDPSASQRGHPVLPTAGARTPRPLPALPAPTDRWPGLPRALRI